MSVVVQSQPEAYGLAHNDNPFVFFSTAYTPTQRFKVVVLPSTYPTDPALATVRVYPRLGVTVGGTVQLNKAFYDPSRILQTQIAGQIAIPSANHLGAFDADNIHYEYVITACDTSGNESEESQPVSLVITGDSHEDLPL